MSCDHIIFTKEERKSDDYDKEYVVCNCGMFVFEEDVQYFKFMDFTTKGLCHKCMNQDVLEYIYTKNTSKLLRSSLINRYEKTTGLKFEDDWSY
jgi:hypothetical protein